MHGANAGYIEQVVIHLGVALGRTGVGDYDPIEFQPLGHVRSTYNHAVGKTSAVGIEQSRLNTGVDERLVQRVGLLLDLAYQRQRAMM